MKQRSISALVFVIIVLGLFYFGNYGAISLLLLVVFGTMYEMMAMQKKTGLQLIFPLLWTAMCLGLMSISNYDKMYFNSLLVITCLSYLMTAGMLFLKFVQIGVWLPKIFYLYPVFGVGLWIRYLLESPSDAVILLVVLIFIWMSDSAAYMVGRKWGQNKLFERISPKKTWEGVVGSALGVLILAGILEFGFSDFYSKVNWFLIGVATVFFGTLGDLLESKIKRENEVKDSGSIMPGHGGIWDRFDSFLFLLPFVLIMILLMR